MVKKSISVSDAVTLKEFYHEFKNFVIFLYIKENMLLNSFIKFICVKKLYFQRYSFSKFEFPNMHIFIGDFTRHYCDVKGVNGEGEKYLFCLEKRSIITSKEPLQTD